MILIFFIGLVTLVVRLVILVGAALGLWEPATSWGWTIAGAICLVLGLMFGDPNPGYERDPVVGEGIDNG